MGTGDGSDEGDETDRDVAMQAQYDWAETKPSTAIVETIAAASEREPTAINPLFDSVDPDAIDTLVMSGDGTTTVGITLSVRLDGYEVSIQRDGVVTVYADPDDESDDDDAAP